MKKLLFIASSALLVFILILVFVFFGTLGRNNPPTAVTPTPTEIPQGETIEISNVPLKNFYKSADKIDGHGDVYLVNDPKKYQILYFEQMSRFLISVTGSPFEQLKSEAETLLLEKTGMTEAEACALDVKITTPYFANPDYSGKSYPLSFCQP